MRTNCFCVSKPTGSRKNLPKDFARPPVYCCVHKIMLTLSIASDQPLSCFVHSYVRKSSLLPPDSSSFLFLIMFLALREQVHNLTLPSCACALSPALCMGGTLLVRGRRARSTSILSSLFFFLSASSFSSSSSLC
jgi:hypothetical protein